jgi:hypothetical protein
MFINFLKMPIEFNAETNILTAILYAQTLDRVSHMYSFEVIPYLLIFW